MIAGHQRGDHKATETTERHGHSRTGECHEPECVLVDSSVAIAGAGWVFVVWLVDPVDNNTAGKEPDYKEIIQQRFALEACDSNQGRVSDCAINRLVASNSGGCARDKTGALLLLLAVPTWRAGRALGALVHNGRSSGWRPVGSGRVFLELVITV